MTGYGGWLQTDNNESPRWGDCEKQLLVDRLEWRKKRVLLSSGCLKWPSWSSRLQSTASPDIEPVHWMGNLCQSAAGCWIEFNDWRDDCLSEMASLKKSFNFLDLEQLKTDSVAGWNWECLLDLIPNPSSSSVQWPGELCTRLINRTRKREKRTEEDNILTDWKPKLISKAQVVVSVEFHWVLSGEQ